MKHLENFSSSTGAIFESIGDEIRKEEIKFKEKIKQRGIVNLLPHIQS